MPIMTQQYLPVVYIICTGLRKKGGAMPPQLWSWGGKCPPPPSSAAYAIAPDQERIMT